MSGEVDAHALPHGVVRLLLAHEKLQVRGQPRHERGAGRDAVAVEGVALRLLLAARRRRRARVRRVPRAAKPPRPLLVHLRGGEAAQRTQNEGAPLRGARRRR